MSSPWSMRVPWRLNIKHKDMKIRREVKMGIFGILILAAAYWGISFLKGMDILSRTDTFYARYEQSNNIEVSSPVLLRGIKIGSVTAIEVGDVHEPITITMKVKSKYRLPSNSVAQIGDKSMLGGKAIIMQVGDASSMLQDGDTITGSVDNNVTEQINEVKDKLTGALDRLSVTLDGVNKLLSDENISSISSTINHINRAGRNADLAISDLRVKLGTITDDMTALTGELNRTAPQLGRTIDNLAFVSDTLRTSLPGLMASINKTVDDVNLTVETIREGEGTIGKLLSDGRMYDNLNRSSASLNSLLVDIKENPKRYVHISVFGRSDREKKKKNNDTDSLDVAE